MLKKLKPHLPLGREGSAFGSPLTGAPQTAEEWGIHQAALH